MARADASPLVSVLLPARDCGALLQPAVASILDQSLRELELIVVDDHSRDGSVAALADEPRLLRLRNPGRGIVSALNAAAAAARGEFLARMDGDDLALPQRLACQLELLRREPELGIVGARVEIFTEHGAPRDGYRRYQDWINALARPQDIRREIFIESPIPHPSAVLRRRLLQQLGGYREVGWPEDYDLWLRAFCAGIGMAKPEPVLLRWRDRPQRLSRRDPRYRAEAFIRAKAYYLARCVLRGRPALIWGAGPGGAMLCDALRAQQVPVSGFLDVDPNKIGRRKRGLPVYAWQRLRDFREAVILCAVGRAEARPLIREALNAAGRVEGRDAWFTA